MIQDFIDMYDDKILKEKIIKRKDKNLKIQELFLKFEQAY